MEHFAEYIMHLVESTLGGLERSGYLGVFVLMVIESSFIPFPSEMVMIPAGYWVGKGEWQFLPTILSGIAGSIVGAWINYGLAVWLGRSVLLRYGKHFFIPESKMIKAEQFFDRHGAITTFVARLIPGVRQLISIPAGLARMDALRFTVYTGLGAGIWVTFLAVVGMIAGRQHQQVESVWHDHGHTITLGATALALALLVVYISWYRWRTTRDATTRQ